jgi:hypothetical protein
VSVSQGQQAVTLFPDFAQPGQLANLTYNEIQSFPAAEAIMPGRLVELAADGLSVQQVQDTGSSTLGKAVLLGFSVLRTAREGAGSIGVTAYGLGGDAYQVGEMVPVLMRGTIWAEWKGTTQTALGTPNVYHSSTIATDRGKLTDAGTSGTVGSEVSTVGSQVRVRRASPGTGSIILVDVNFPGAN